jgi:hypothetical protein
LKERLNIIIKKSTYTFIILDFIKVLKPNEVYLNLLGFKDKVIGLPIPLINEKEVLVIRSLIYSISDI